LFSATDPVARLLAAFGVFAVGYLMRPLGSALFGYVGDRFGRRRMLVMSVLLMAIPSALMGLLPTYRDVGLLAPVLLVVLRMLQGLSAGGEYTGCCWLWSWV
jgi:MFS transporter, MHS family, proline/betaine transporter